MFIVEPLGVFCKKRKFVVLYSKVPGWFLGAPLLFQCISGVTIYFLLLYDISYWLIWWMDGLQWRKFIIKIAAINFIIYTHIYLKNETRGIRVFLAWECIYLSASILFLNDWGGKMCIYFNVEYTFVTSNHNSINNVSIRTFENIMCMELKRNLYNNLLLFLSIKFRCIQMS